MTKNGFVHSQTMFVSLYNRMTGDFDQALRINLQTFVRTSQDMLLQIAKQAKVELDNGRLEKAIFDKGKERTVLVTYPLPSSDSH